MIFTHFLKIVLKQCFLLLQLALWGESVQKLKRRKTTGFSCRNKDDNAKFSAELRLEHGFS